MCDSIGEKGGRGLRTVPVREAVGTVLAHDITEIRKHDFKGPAFRKGHIVRKEDICHLQRLGKEHLYVLQVADDEMHEDDAARAIAAALMGEGVTVKGEPREGKITIIAGRDGLLKVDAAALREFNLLGDVMCATLHTNTVVRKGQEVAGTRAIPLVVKRALIDEAVRTAKKVQSSESRVERTGVVEVKEIRKPRAGVVITGNEVYHGRIKDAFAPIIAKKVEEYGGEVVGTYYAPDDEPFIESRLRELLKAGADLLITTGGMSVDPDDVTRFAIRNLGAADITYGSAVLPGAMVLVGYLDAEGRGCSRAGGQGEDDRGGNVNNDSPPHPRAAATTIPILGIPACGMYHRTTVFDLVLPRVLAGERIGRPELAELGHGGLCLNCAECRWPVCPFGK
jgi:molybdenum cofactor synthesis domain-containing protein